MRITLGQIYTDWTGKRYAVNNFYKTASGRYVTLELVGHNYGGFLRYRLDDFKEDVKAELWNLDIKADKARKFKKQLEKV